MIFSDIKWHNRIFILYLVANNSRSKACRTEEVGPRQKSKLLFSFLSANEYTANVQHQLLDFIVDCAFDSVHCLYDLGRKSFIARNVIAASLIARYLLLVDVFNHVGDVRSFVHLNELNEQM